MNVEPPSQTREEGAVSQRRETVLVRTLGVSRGPATALVKAAMWLFAAGRGVGEAAAGRVDIGLAGGWSDRELVGRTEAPPETEVAKMSRERMSLLLVPAMLLADLGRAVSACHMRSVVIELAAAVGTHRQREPRGQGLPRSGASRWSTTCLSSRRRGTDAGWWEWAVTRPAVEAPERRAHTMAADNRPNACIFVK